MSNPTSQGNTHRVCNCGCIQGDHHVAASPIFTEPLRFTFCLTPGCECRQYTPPAGVTVTHPEDTARDVLSALVAAQAGALETAGSYATAADRFRETGDAERSREYRDQASHHVERAERLYEAAEALRAAIGAQPVIQLGVAA
jgi:hypothetical protein